MKKQYCKSGCGCIYGKDNSGNHGETPCVWEDEPDALDFIKTNPAHLAWNSNLPIIQKMKLCDHYKEALDDIKLCFPPQRFDELGGFNEEYGRGWNDYWNAVAGLFFSLSPDNRAANGEHIKQGHSIDVNGNCNMGCC